MKNKTIAETLDHKVWKAIDAMIEGLEEYSKLSHFEIRMTTFGNYNFAHEICYGYAATRAAAYAAAREKHVQILIELLTKEEKK